jgi:hypothetical protein
VASARADLQKAWRDARTSPSFYSLVATNLLPLIGIAFLHWRVDTLILFYLIECAVAYVVTAKMLAVVADDRDLPEGLSRGFLIQAGLSIIMVGWFWGFGLGFFWELRRDANWVLTFLPSAAFVAATHVYSYLHNFIGRKEYERYPVKSIQARWWGGAFLGTFVVGLVFPLLMLFDSPTPFVAVLIAIKTLVAISGFLEDRARAEGSKATSIAYTRPTATCPRCHQILRTDNAKQCFHCGADWHKSAA